ncbi:MAG TPA: hypothetical protein VK674_07615 [Candidatus Limnocylindria bacterium]|nr:hypothetical protein [Candidatus Limnocylindria bacterium]
MQPYQCKVAKFSGTSYAEIERQARKVHTSIAARTKRNAYIRSAYFHKDKIFVSLFWQHLNQKRQRDRKRRLRYYACAIELLRHSRFEPATKENTNKSGEILHRFAGISADGDIFYVQVKEVKRTDNKFFISVFPPQ